MTKPDSRARLGRVVLCGAGLLTALLYPSAAMGQTVVFNQGPTTGTNGGAWTNSTSSQNFADQATLASTTTITAIAIFTSDAPNVQTVHVKILSDNGSGAPGSVLYSEDKTPDVWSADAASGGYKVTVRLTTPFQAQAGVTYWYGISGNSGSINQYSVLSPGDGHMAQFSGAVYGFSTAVGDQMFELESGPVEAIPTLGHWGLLGFALLVAAAGLAALRRLV